KVVAAGRRNVGPLLQATKARVEGGMAWTWSVAVTIRAADAPGTWKTLLQCAEGPAYYGEVEMPTCQTGMCVYAYTCTRPRPLDITYRRRQVLGAGGAEGPPRRPRRRYGVAS